MHKEYLKNNGSKIPKFDITHEYTYSRNPTNSKKNKHKEIHTENIINILTAKVKKKILKAARDKWHSR